MSESGSEFLLAKCLKSIDMLPSPKQRTEDDIEESFTDTTISSVGSHQLKEAVESDGLQYLAGYLAEVFKDKHPWMGCHTYELSESEPHPSWVVALSRGGLIKPTDEWLNMFNKMDKYFEKYNEGMDFHRKRNVVGGMSSFIMKKQIPNLKQEVVIRFVRL